VGSSEASSGALWGSDLFEEERKDGFAQWSNDATDLLFGQGFNILALVSERLSRHWRFVVQFQPIRLSPIPIDLGVIRIL